MSKITVSLGDVNDRLSVAYAQAHGYQFRLIGDGDAEITDSGGTVYRVQNFACDCLDKFVNGGSHNGRCAHEIWLAQLYPCSNCGGMMGLGVFHTCFGGRAERFECPECGNARDFELVRMERKAMKEEFVDRMPEAVL